MRLVGYRHAAYDTPWWAFPSSRSGRFHRAGTDVVQYLCLHPLGPAAEALRHHVGPDGNPDDVVLNLWAATVELPDAPRRGGSGSRRPRAGAVVTVDFDDCEAHGITPEELVGDDHEPTRALADAVRAGGASAMVVPSAALPGTHNLVLFGVRVAHPYLLEAAIPEEVPTGHLTDAGRAPAEVADHVRWLGTPHPSVEEWRRTGTYAPFDDPLPTRW